MNIHEKQERMEDVLVRLRCEWGQYIFNKLDSLYSMFNKSFVK